MPPLDGLTAAADAFESALDIVALLPQLTVPVRIGLIVARIPCLFFRSFSCVVSSIDIHTERKFYHIATTALRICAAKAPQNVQTQAMQDVLNELGNIDKARVISARLNFSNEAHNALQKKMYALRVHITTKTVTSSDVEFVRHLAARTRRHIAENMFDTVNGCISIAASIIGMCPVPFAAQVASAVLFAASDVMTLALWVVRTLFHNSNPFDPSSRCCVSVALSHVKTKLDIHYKR
jgi:hypothetical protein